MSDTQSTDNSPCFFKRGRTRRLMDCVSIDSSLKDVDRDICSTVRKVLSQRLEDTLSRTVEFLEQTVTSCDNQLPVLLIAVGTNQTDHSQLFDDLCVEVQSATRKIIRIHANTVQPGCKIARLLSDIVKRIALALQSPSQHKKRESLEDCSFSEVMNHVARCEIQLSFVFECAELLPRNVLSDFICAVNRFTLMQKVSVILEVSSTSARNIINIISPRASRFVSITALQSVSPTELFSAVAEELYIYPDFKFMVSPDILEQFYEIYISHSFGVRRLLNCYRLALLLHHMENPLSMFGCDQSEAKALFGKKVLGSCLKERLALLEKVADKKILKDDACTQLEIMHEHFDSAREVSKTLFECFCVILQTLGSVNQFGFSRFQRYVSFNKGRQIFEGKEWKEIERYISVMAVDKLQELGTCLLRILLPCCSMEAFCRALTTWSEDLGAQESKEQAGRVMKESARQPDVGSAKGTSFTELKHRLREAVKEDAKQLQSQLDIMRQSFARFITTDLFLENYIDLSAQPLSHCVLFSNRNSLSHCMSPNIADDVAKCLMRVSSAGLDRSLHSCLRAPALYSALSTFSNSFYIRQLFDLCIANVVSRKSKKDKTKSPSDTQIALFYYSFSELEWLGLVKRSAGQRSFRTATKISLSPSCVD